MILGTEQKLPRPRGSSVTGQVDRLIDKPEISELRHQFAAAEALAGEPKQD
jgi:hypothetical protein